MARSMITNAKESRSMLEMVHIKRVEVAQEHCFYIYSFLGEHRNPVKNNAPDAANIPNLEEMDEVAFRNSAKQLSSQGGKFIVVSLHPRFYSELEVESRQKVYAALQSFHDADSFGILAGIHLLSCFEYVKTTLKTSPQSICVLSSFSRV